jgi:hypothetical protein
LRSIWIERLCISNGGNARTPGDPRPSFAIGIIERWFAIVSHRDNSANVRDEILHSMLLPFVMQYIPPAHNLLSRLVDPVAEPIGIVLASDTARTLARTRLAARSYSPLMVEVIQKRAFYIDIPSGTVPLLAGNPKPELNLRAIFAASYLLPHLPGSVLLLAQLVRSGTEHDAGLIAAVLNPDGSVSHLGDGASDPRDDILSLSNQIQLPDEADAILDRIGEFAKLALAYYYFGPEEERHYTKAAAASAFNGRKKSRKMSLFALTRIESSRGPRKEGMLAVQTALESQQTVLGHFKLQAYGAGFKKHRLIWIDGYDRGPSDGPKRPKAKFL